MFKKVGVVHRGRAALLTLVAAVATLPSQAAQWREIWGDGTRADSECIGSVETPQCLVETIIACDVCAFRRHPTTCSDLIRPLVPMGSDQ